MPKLITTFQVNGLYSDGNQRGVSPHVDFSKIAYFDRGKNKVVNPNEPYISEQLVSQPFQDEKAIFARGLHLHFLLPKFLRSSLPMLKDGKVVDDFPPIPNRWLVQKNNREQFIVESDYFYPTNHLLTDKITIPIPWDIIKAKELEVPFRYMGRQYNLKNQPNDEASYWHDLLNEPLTALGYGELTFASFFPNCRGVLSFYDADAKNGDLYQVWGWYDYGQDTTAQLDRLFSYINEKGDIEQVQATLVEEWGIQMVNPLVSTDDNQLFLYSTFQVDELGKLVPRIEKDDYQVGIGNEGTEAIAALIAAHKNDAMLETWIEAMQFDELKGQHADIGAKFIEARHGKSFESLEGGMQYQCIYEIDKPFANPSKGQKAIQELWQDKALESLLPDIHQQTVLLNQKQKEYNKSFRKIQGMRHQLFADWYKYMQSAHPPYKGDGNYPNPDDILRFLQDHSIQSMQKLVDQIGFLEVSADLDKPYVPEGLPTIGLAKTIITLFEELQKRIEKVNNTIAEILKAKLKEVDVKKEALTLSKDNLSKNPSNQQLIYDKEQAQKAYERIQYFEEFKERTLSYRSFSTTDERYFSAHEPVVVIAKKGKTQSNGHNQVAACMSDDEFKSFAKRIQSRLIPIMYTDWHKDHFQKSYQSDWQLLDWEVFYYPICDPSIMDKGYDADFLFDHFDIFPDTPDFLAIEGKRIDLSMQPRRYAGTSILANGTAPILQKKIKEFAKSIPNDQPNIQAIVDYLDDWELMSQSLGGFNEALLMRKQTLQLEVADPIAFKDYQPLIDKVSWWVGNARTSAPEPNYYFNPIRGGAMHMGRLRLVDSFGIYTNIFDHQVAESLTIAQTLALPATANLSNKFKSLKDKLVYLPPRFVQPARLNAAWVSNKYEGTGDSPICGWMMPNFLEKSIAFFNQAGELLGSLGIIEDEVKLIPKAGDVTFYLSSITNPHLRNVVRYFCDPSKYEGSKPFVQLLQKFITNIRYSLDHLEPERYTQHEGVALLTGKPLAIVQCELSLELMGDAAINQDWKVFKQDLYQLNPKRDTYNFEQVKIPLRIGDYDQLNDGVIGFWYRELIEKNGKLEYETPIGRDEHTVNLTDAFYMPLANKPQPITRQVVVDKSDLTGGRKSFMIEQSVADESQTITLLFDPLSTLNISSGILPVKQISISTEHYQQALSKLCMQFLVSPVITPFEQVQLALPKGNRDKWTWLTTDKDHHIQELPLQPNIHKEHLITAYESVKQHTTQILWNMLIEKKWLTVSGDKKVMLGLFDEQLSQPFTNYGDTIRNILLKLATTGDHTIDQLKFVLSYHESITSKQQGIWEVLVEKKWLEPLPKTPYRAYINFSTEDREKLSDYYDEEQISKLLNAHFEGIAAPSYTPIFEQMAIKEGWLAFYPYQ